MKRRTTTARWVVAALAAAGALTFIPGTANPGWAATSNVTVNFGTSVRPVSATQLVVS